MWYSYVIVTESLLCHNQKIKGVWCGYCGLALERGPGIGFVVHELKTIGILVLTVAKQVVYSYDNMAFVTIGI